MKSENISLPEDSEISSDKRPYVSQAVIKRLPRYFRYLRELIAEGTMRISSGELSARMHVTASQIRQDLNCFGGFGQQGYGYNVHYLYAKICEILGVSAGFKAVIIGAGNLGRALAGHTMFAKRGVDVIAMFDVNEQLIGSYIGDIPVLSMDELENYCRTHPVDIAVFTMPKEAATQVAEQLTSTPVKGIWNFTAKELDLREQGKVVESVHMGDSLMTLCYELCRMQETIRDDAEEEIK
ncbi:MAG: redox-sensing transcriptional repressor Rex [Clostridia bacterium]|nr:redox-sensing transcriptional repressor Rex [Clostridia bacterium]